MNTIDKYLKNAKLYYDRSEENIDIPDKNVSVYQYLTGLGFNITKCRKILETESLIVNGEIIDSLNKTIDPRKAKIKIGR